MKGALTPTLRAHPVSSLARKIEIGANLAIMFVAVALGAILLRNVFSPPAGLPAAIPAGTSIQLGDVDWARSRQTLLIALSVDCRYCSESAPFYQRLLQTVADRPDVQVVAVLPQQVDQARAYLETLRVPVKEIRQVSLGSIHVIGTPTLILVDGRGLVTHSWIGKLPPDKEAEVLDRLRAAPQARARAAGF